MAGKTQRILLVTGGGAHDFVAGRAALLAFLQSSGRFEVDEAQLTDAGVEAFSTLSPDTTDAVLLYTQGGKLTDAQEQGLINYVEAGGGLVGIHCANDSFRDNPGFTKLIGSKFVGHPPGVFRFAVAFTLDAKEGGDPIAVRADDFTIEDEHYQIELTNEVSVFAESMLRGEDVPMGYRRTQGKGTVVYLANGHHVGSLTNPHFQRMLERSLREAAGDKLETGKVRAGILGYGGAFNMGRQHAQSINAQLGMETVAVCDLDPARTKQANEELGDEIRTFNNMEQFLADDSFDLVVVILPHNLHAKACIGASEGGKHVVTEKPFCITLEEADAMLAAADKAGTMLSCYHNRRWDGSFHRLFQAVHGGDIGEVYHVDCASAGYGMPGTWWRASKEISGGVLYDWGAHFTDWLLNLIPHRIESVTGIMQKRYWHQSSNEDYAKAIVRFENGTTAEIEQGTLAAVPKPVWRILGTTGGIEVESLRGPAKVTKMIDGVRHDSSVDFPDGRGINYYQNVANHLFYDEPLIVAADEARRVIGVIHLAEQSAAQGGKPLPLPGEDEFTPRVKYPI